MNSKVCKKFGGKRNMKKCMALLGMLGFLIMLTQPAFSLCPVCPQTNPCPTVQAACPVPSQIVYQPRIIHQFKQVAEPVMTYHSSTVLEPVISYRAKTIFHPQMAFRTKTIYQPSVAYEPILVSPAHVLVGAAAPCPVPCQASHIIGAACPIPIMLGAAAPCPVPCQAPRIIGAACPITEETAAPICCPSDRSFWVKFKQDFLMLN